MIFRQPINCDEECDHVNPQTLDRGAWQSGTAASDRIVAETQEQNSIVY